MHTIVIQWEWFMFYHVSSAKKQQNIGQTGVDFIKVGRKA
jgi:hypothetical protein